MNLEVPDEMLEDYYRTTVTNRFVINHVNEEEDNEDSKEKIYFLLLIILLLLIVICALVRYIYKNTARNKKKIKKENLKKNPFKTYSESTFTRSALSRSIPVDSFRSKQTTPKSTKRKRSRIKSKRKPLNKLRAQKRNNSIPKLLQVVSELNSNIHSGQLKIVSEKNRYSIGKIKIKFKL